MKPVFMATHAKIAGIIILLLASSCETFIDIGAQNTQIVRTTVFADDLNANSAMAGIYSAMMENSTVFTNGSNSVTLLSGLSADELEDQSGGTEYSQFSSNELSVSNSLVYSLWSDLYATIYNANSVIEGLAASTGITADAKSRFTGEAKFVRAFCHFYLTNLFGNIPVVLTTDYRQNAIVPRSEMSDVYLQIVADLKEAQTSLPADFPDTRVRPNKWAATALLARVYLYNKEWAKAEAESTKLLNSTAFSLEPELANVFQATSVEAIWQLQPVLPGYNTFDGTTFILTSAPTVASLRNDFLGYFEDGDKRKEQWIGTITANDTGYYFPYKYKVKTGTELTEYLMVFRLAEQYLIRAECKAMQGNIEGAVSDLNIVRQRAGLVGVSSAITQAECLEYIARERTTEFFCEWGHRWFDLKRTGKAEELAAIKNGWLSSDVLYPIPLNEIQNNQNLLPQNDGY